MKNQQIVLARRPAAGVVDERDFRLVETEVPQPGGVVGQTCTGRAGTR